MNEQGINIGLCLCGSFCTFSEILDEAISLKDKGYNIYPIMSNNAEQIDTRFGSAKYFKERLKEITGNDIILTIKDAEPIGPKKYIDVMIVAPCTGNTLAKLNNGITDTTVTMACKAHLRNNKPLIIALSTNDALGISLKNIGGLLVRKNVYFVPFGQDDYVKKPLSMIADFKKIDDTIKSALKGEQIQPILL